MKSWGRAEKEVAKLLGGIRRVRVSYGESIGDIVHPVFSTEVKWGKQIPKSVVTKHPTIFGDYVVISTKQLGRAVKWEYRNKHLKFLEKGIKQAVRYDRSKLPLLAMKPKNYRGVIFAMRYDDWCDREEFRGYFGKY